MAEIKAPSTNPRNRHKNREKQFPIAEELALLTPEELVKKQAQLERIFRQTTETSNKIAEILNARTAEITEGDNFDDTLIDSVNSDPISAESAPATADSTAAAPNEATVSTSAQIDPFAVDHQYTELAGDVIQTAFSNPASESEKVIKQMLEDRVAMLADEKMKALPAEGWKNSPWYKKPFSFLKGAVTNLTSSKTYNETKNKILYKNGVSGELSDDAVTFYKQLHETIHFAERSGGTEKMLLDTLKGKALNNSTKEPRSRLMQKVLDTGFGRSIATRLGKDGSFNVKADKSSAALAMSGTAAAGFGAVALAGLTRGLLRFVPVVGAGISAAIFGRVAEGKKLKSLKTFVKTHLSHTVFNGVSEYPTFAEIKGKLQASDNPYFQLMLAKAVIDKTLEDGRQDKDAGIMGLTAFLAHINTLKKDFESSNSILTEELKNSLSKESSSIREKINTENKTRLKKATILGAVIGTGAAGLLMTAHDVLSTPKVSGTPTSSLETVKANAIAKAAAAKASVNHTSIAPTAGQSAGIVDIKPTAGLISEQYIDDHIKIGNTEYVLLKANDGNKNYPVMALPDGRIPYKVFSEEANLSVSAEYLANNTKDLKMNIGGVKVYPVADFNNEFDSNIEVHFASAETISDPQSMKALLTKLNVIDEHTPEKEWKSYVGQASTFFQNGKRIIVCPPEYTNEELFHGAMGISDEPVEHGTKYSGTKGEITEGEQALLTRKQNSVLTTTNENAMPVNGVEGNNATDIDYTTVAAAQKEHVLKLYNELNEMRARLGNPQATKAAIASAKLELERYQHMHVSPDTLQTAGTFYEGLQARADKVGALFGSYGSEDPVRNNTGSYNAYLISKGYPTEKFSDYANSMVGLEEDFKGNSEYLFNRYVAPLEADPSPEAKKLLLNAYQEKLSNLIKEDYSKGIGRETQKSFIDFDPPTVENVNLYRDTILAEKLRIQDKIISVQDDIAIAETNKRQLTEYVRNLERQYREEVAAEATYNTKLAAFNYQQALAVKSQNLAANLQATSKNITAKVPNLDSRITTNADKTLERSLPYAPRPVQSTFDPLAELYKNASGVNNTNISGGSSANHSPIDGGGVNNTTDQPYFIDTRGNSRDIVVDPKTLLDSLDNTTDGQKMVNSMINSYFPDAIYPTPGAKADAMVEYLDTYINKVKSQGSKFTTAFSPQDAIEIGNVRIGDYSLKEIMADPRLKADFTKALIDTPTNNIFYGENGATLTLSEREMQDFNWDPKKHEYIEWIKRQAKMMDTYLSTSPNAKLAANIAITIVALGVAIWAIPKLYRGSKAGYRYMRYDYDKKIALQRRDVARKDLREKRRALSMDPTNAALITDETTARNAYKDANDAAIAQGLRSVPA
ncbi:MAG: hypothetical protein ACK4NC_01155 [Candidatus Gracilibacteria bacterium]